MLVVTFWMELGADCGRTTDRRSCIFTKCATFAGEGLRSTRSQRSEFSPDQMAKSLPFSLQLVAARKGIVNSMSQIVTAVALREVCHSAASKLSPVLPLRPNFN